MSGETLFGLPIRVNPELDARAEGDIEFGDLGPAWNRSLHAAATWATGTPVFQRREDGVYFVEPPRWPKRILITKELIQDSNELLSWSSFRHLRMRAKNAQAIYRLVWRGRSSGEPPSFVTFAGELVYGELA